MGRRPKKLRPTVADMHRKRAKEYLRKRDRARRLDDLEKAKEAAAQIQKARDLIRDTIRLGTDYMPSFTIPGHVIRQEPNNEEAKTFLLELETAEREEQLLASLLLVGGRATPEEEREAFAAVLKRLHDAIDGAKKIGGKA